MYSAANLEAGLTLVTSGLVAAGLAWCQDSKYQLEAFSCLLLSVIAVAVETLCCRSIERVYQQRQAPPGIALGALTVPWVASAVAGKYLRHGIEPIFSLMALRFSLASSALILGFIISKASSSATNAQAPAPTNSVGGSYGRSSLPTLTLNSFFNVFYGAFLAWGLAAWPLTFQRSDLLWHRARAAGASVASVAAFHLIMTKLPKTLTLGEAIVATQGLGQVLCAVFYQTTTNPSSPLSVSKFSSFTFSTLLFSIGMACLLAVLLRHPPAAPTNGNASSGALKRAAVVTLAAVCIALRPLLWLLQYILDDQKRVHVVVGWGVLMAGALPAMLALARSHRVPQIIVRKGYHVLAVALFLPTLLSQPQLLGMALAVACGALAAVEVIRTGKIPGITTRIHQFMNSFVDDRDSGALYVTHFTLLLGLAIPVWLSNALDDVIPQEAVQRLWYGAFSGIVSIGLGDAAASVIGSRLGRVPVAPGSKKTVEGTLAGWTTSMIVWKVLVHAHLIPAPVYVFMAEKSLCVYSGWVALGVATGLSSLLEAATEQLDNLFVPLHYFALICFILQ